MKKFLPFLALTLIISVYLTYNLGVSFAEYSSKAAKSVAYIEPTPPAENPHPPATNEDKKRVAFAESILKSLLVDNKLTASNKPLVTWQNSDALSFKLTEDCLNTPNCLNKNEQLKHYIHSLSYTFGSIVEYKHPHIIPWSFERFKKSNSLEKVVVPAPPGTMRYAKPNHVHSAQAESTRMQAPNLKPDEYMIHIYVKFSKSSRWHHVDVIVSEDGAGKLEFRSFFILQIPTQSHDLPDGVVC